MKKVITTMLVAAMVLSMAMPTSAATITRKKSSGTTASTTKVSGDYSLKMVDKTLQFIRGGKVVSSIETKDGKITLRKSSKGGISVVFTDANGKRRNITLGAQKTVTLSGTFVQVSVDKALGSSFEVEMEKGSKVTNFYAKGAAKVTLNGSVTTLNVTSSNANVAANGTVSRAYAVNKKSITGMAAGKITQTSTGTSASGSVNTATKSSNSSNTTVNSGSGSSGSSSSGNSGIIINGGGSNGGTVVKTTAAKEAAKITAAKIGTASVKVGATASEVKAAVEAKAKALVASGYTVTFNQTSAADTSKAGSTSVTGTFTVSKGSDKATTKAITVSVNVTEVTVPAEISSVKADNGRVNIVLAKKPSVVPTDANFKPVIKAYIDGSTTGVNLDGLAFEGYDENSLTVAYKFSPIPATDKEQSVVVGAKLANANEVRADAFKIPATVKAAIANVKALNGSIEIELVEDPSTEVNAESFAPVIKAYVDDKEIALEDVTFVKYDKASKTVSYTFKEIAPAAKAQSVVIGAKLGDANEVRAKAFTVPSVDDVVEAEIDTVTATNGTANIKLKAAPTNDPTAANFQPVLKAYINNAAEGVALDEVTFVEYDKATATVKLSFKAIAATNEAQSVKVGAKLDNGEEKISDPFTIAAATSEIQWTKPLVMPTEGVVDGVLTLSDKPTVLTVEATVEGGVDYQWFRTLSSDGTGGTAVGTNSPSYTITQEDASEFKATYYVVATSKKDATISSTSDKIAFTKIVVPNDSAIQPKVTFSTAPHNVEFGSSNKPKLEVTVGNASDITKSGGVLSYQWFDVAVVNGVEQPAVEIENTNSDKNIFLAPVDKVGVHKYYCVVTNTNDKAEGLKTSSVTTGKAQVTVGETIETVINYANNKVTVEVKSGLAGVNPDDLMKLIKVTGSYAGDNGAVDVPITITGSRYVPSTSKITYTLDISGTDGFIVDGVAKTGTIKIELPQEYQGFKFTPYQKSVSVTPANSDTLEVTKFEAVAPAKDEETKQLTVTYNEPVTITPTKDDFTVAPTTGSAGDITVDSVTLSQDKKTVTLNVTLPNSPDTEYKLSAAPGKFADAPTIEVVRDTTPPTMDKATYSQKDHRITLLMSEDVKVTKDQTVGLTDFKLYSDEAGATELAANKIKSVTLNGTNEIIITLDTDVTLVGDVYLKYEAATSYIEDTAANANKFKAHDTTATPPVISQVKLIGTEAAAASDIKAEDVKVAAPTTKAVSTDAEKPKLADGTVVKDVTAVDKFDLTVEMAEPFVTEANSGGSATELKDIIQVVGSDNKTYQVDSATPKSNAAPVLKSVKGAGSVVSAYNAIDIQVKLPEGVTIKSIKFVIETSSTGEVTSKVVIKTVANEPVKEIPPVNVDTTTPTKVTAKGTASLTALNTVVVTLTEGSFSDGAKITDNWSITEIARPAAKAAKTAPTIESVTVSGKTATLTLNGKVPADNDGKYQSVKVTAKEAAFAAADTIVPTIGSGSDKGLVMDASFDVNMDDITGEDFAAARKILVDNLEVWGAYGKSGAYDISRTSNGFTTKIKEWTPWDAEPNNKDSDMVPAYGESHGDMFTFVSNKEGNEAAGFVKTFRGCIPIGITGEYDSNDEETGVSRLGDFELVKNWSGNGGKALFMHFQVIERIGPAFIPDPETPIAAALVLGESGTNAVAMAAAEAEGVTGLGGKKTCDFKKLENTLTKVVELSKDGVKYAFNVTATSDISGNITVTVDEGTAELL